MVTISTPYFHYGIIVVVDITLSFLHALFCRYPLNYDAGQGDSIVEIQG